MLVLTPSPSTHTPSCCPLPLPPWRSPVPNSHLRPPAPPPPPPTMASALLLLLLLLLPSASSSEDLQLLLSFKASLPNPDALPTWRPSADPCSFQGVSCSPSARAVTSLRLDSLPLATDIRHVATHLFPLPSLISLSLRDTNLTGLLSAVSVSRCSPVLADLDLSSNSLRGPFTGLAVLTASCPSLLSVNLSGNSLASASASVAASAPPPLRVEVLDLSLNKILESSALEWLLSAGSVQLLYLSGNHLAGDIPLPSNCSVLRHLDLSDNNLTGLSSFDSCGNLQLLNVSGNVISGTVPDDIFGSCRNLLLLDLSFNSLSGPLPAALAYCTALEVINLSNNNFSGELPVDVLNSMNSLKKLQFGFNSFSGKLPDLLAKISGLEVLDFSSNLLAGAIPEGLCQNPGGVELKELYLQGNLLTGRIPPSISNCSKLVSLDLSFNFLSGRIPSSIGSLAELQDLHMWENLLEGEIPGELMYVTKLENLILDNNGLTGSIPDGLSNCTNLNWISLSSNHLTGSIPPWIGRFEKLAILKLGNNSLSGPIPPEIGNCKSLIWLDLNSNQLSGSIPPTISKQSGYIAVGLVTGKKYVYLRNDGSRECRGAGNLLEFAGIRPEQLDRVPTRRSCNFTRVYAGATQYTFNNNGSIIFLDLSYNNLEGEIPKELGDMFYVMVVNLGHNQLSGLIPPELGNLRSIGILDLSHNALEGPIPQSFSHLAMLSELDLSYNNLNGSIPEVGQLATFPAYRYENNPGLCGLPLPPCGSNSSLNGDQSRKSRRRQASLAGSVAMGLLFSLFCIFGLIIIAIESKKRKQKRKENGRANGARDPYADSRSYSGTVGNSTWKQLTATREALSVNLLTFENPLRKLTLADLLEATNGFHSDCLVGSGGFGDVYKAELKDGSVVAVKKLIHVSGQGDREFMAEMETIGKIKHRNLVPLLGYCKVQEERLLVYEYMKYGSLEDVLHSKKKAGVKLNWAARQKIAVGAARGLAFLHHNCIPHIIHRDMKSSNVLLDDSLEARVSDFGMARMMSAMDTHLSVSTLAGTPGYVPPEYYQSFRCSTKGDVYSYGVVLLELLTGRRPTDSADFGDNNLVGWVKQHSKLRISDVFDKDLLKEDPTLELELLEHLKIACACLDDRPLRRPNMLKVMAMFKEIQAGSTVDSTASAATGSVDGGFGMVEMSLQECKEERE